MAKFVREIKGWPRNRKTYEVLVGRLGRIVRGVRRSVIPGVQHISKDLVCAHIAWLDTAREEGDHDRDVLNARQRILQEMYA